MSDKLRGARPSWPGSHPWPAAALLPKARPQTGVCLLHRMLHLLLHLLCLLRCCRFETAAELAARSGRRLACFLAGASAMCCRLRCCYSR